MCEILSPAGDMKCLRAAVQSGADAVYIGGKDFSARKYAGNFSRDEIPEAVRYCHLRHVKVYVAVNTMLFQDELMKAAEYCAFLRNEGVDAVIVADMGLANILREHTDISVHASTQMCVHNRNGAELLKQAGFDRVVLSRELSLAEIKDIADTGIETEVFVHGALCSSVSGLCLMSSFIGQRSGNRGACAQPCRLPYKVGNDENYYLSTADLCAADILPELVLAGVSSLKIEGRMKSPSYVAGVTGVYRNALDSMRCDRPVRYSDQLKKFYNRTFTDGYFFGRTDVCAPDRPDNRPGTESEYAETEKKYYFPKGKICLETGFCPVFSVSCGDSVVTAEGSDILEKAVKPIEAETVRQSVMKTGGTPFEFADIEVIMKGDPFISKSSLNGLRREALEKLEKSFAAVTDKRDFAFDTEHKTISHCLEKVFVETSKINIAFEAIRNGADRIYYAPSDYSAKSLAAVQRIYEETGVKPYIKLVPFLRNDDVRYTEDNIHRCREFLGGVLCGNFSQISVGKAAGTCVSDYTFNTANSECSAFLEKLGFDGITLSSEMSKKNIKQMEGNLPSEMIVFGYLPLMWFAHDVPEKLQDRKGYEYNIREYSLMHKLSALDNPVLMCVKELSGLRSCIDAVRLIINDTVHVQAVKHYVAAVRNGKDVKSFIENTTQGHLKRGV